MVLDLVDLLVEGAAQLNGFLHQLGLEQSLQCFTLLIDVFFAELLVVRDQTLQLIKPKVLPAFIQIEIVHKLLLEVSNLHFYEFLAGHLNLGLFVVFLLYSLYEIFLLRYLLVYHFVHLMHDFLAVELHPLLLLGLKHLYL